MSPAFAPEQVDFFKVLAAEFCEMFTALFNNTLKPKFHNLLLYHLAMLRFGPLRYLSSMRYEAKHHPNKLAAKSSNNRQNMTLTIARKHQLMLNDTFLKENIGLSLSFGDEKEISRREVEQIKDKIELSKITKLYKVSWAAKCSERYKANSIIVSAIEEQNVRFAKVEDVYVDGVSKIIINFWKQLVSMSITMLTTYLTHLKSQ